VLVIKLNNGTTVSGMVTNFTRIVGEPASVADNDADDNGQGGNDQGSGEDKGHFVGHWFNGEKGHCTTAALTSGAVVIAAELAITGKGSFFTKVILMSCPSTGSTGSSGPTGSTGSTGDNDDMHDGGR
jgi:hypothetical protein